MQFSEIDTSAVHSATPPMLPAVRRDWLVFGLAAGCLVLAGVSICLTIAVWRRYTPKVVIREVVREITAERPGVVQDEPVNPINLKASSLVKHMMQVRGFLVQHQDKGFILMCEREVPKRVYVAIDVAPDGLIKRAETSIFVKHANADVASMNHFVLDCMAFMLFFKEEPSEEKAKNLIHVAKNITDGLRDYETYTGELAHLRFDRGPRDFHDAFILTARPLSK